MSKYFYTAKNVCNVLFRTHCTRSAATRALRPLQCILYKRPVKIFTTLALFWPLKSEPKPEPIEIIAKSLNSHLIEADTFFDNEQYQECLDYIKQIDEAYQKDVEVLWRKSRVLYQLANQSSTAQSIRNEFANEAYQTITMALTVNENHFAVHKWMSVILDLKCSFVSLSDRIKNLENVKKHMMRAIEINPRDATTLYMLGEWCYRIADMPWYQRRIAQTLFATPPTSSYEEAIQYFSRAEVAEPRFYSMNLLMLGKTYLKLGKKDIAEYYLNLALLYPARSNDDHQANKEAQEILKRL